MSKQNKKSEAKEKILLYFEKAGESANRQELARGYIKKARGLAMHLNIKMPKELRKKFCRKCNSFFNAGNCNIRLKQGFLVLRCLNCGRVARYKV